MNKIERLEIVLEPFHLTNGMRSLTITVNVNGMKYSHRNDFFEDDFESIFDTMLRFAARELKFQLQEHEPKPIAR